MLLLVGSQISISFSSISIYICYIENGEWENRKKNEKMKSKRERERETLWITYGVCGGISTIMSYMLCYHIHRLVKYCTFWIVYNIQFGWWFYEKKNCSKKSIFSRWILFIFNENRFQSAISQTTKFFFCLIIKSMRLVFWFVDGRQHPFRQRKKNKGEKRCIIGKNFFRFSKCLVWKWTLNFFFQYFSVIVCY